MAGAIGGTPETPNVPFGPGSRNTASDLGAQVRSITTKARWLPRAAMEKLVLIALHQPVTRHAIEDIRGVGVAQTMLDLLLESRLA